MEGTSLAAPGLTWAFPETTPGSEGTGDGNTARGFTAGRIAPNGEKLLGLVGTVWMSGTWNIAGGKRLRESFFFFIVKTTKGLRAN